MYNCRSPDINKIDLKFFRFEVQSPSSIHLLPPFPSAVPPFYATSFDLTLSREHAWYFETVFFGRTFLGSSKPGNLSSLIWDDPNFETCSFLKTVILAFVSHGRNASCHLRQASDQNLVWCGLGGTNCFHCYYSRCSHYGQISSAESSQSSHQTWTHELVLLRYELFLPLL